MKILMVTPFYPPDPGGISEHVARIATILSKEYHCSVFIASCSVKNSNLAHQNKNINVNNIMIPSIIPPIPRQTLKSLRIPLQINLLKTVIEKVQPDIIHAHGHHYPITWIAAYMSKKRKIPFILTLHGMYALTTKPTILEEIFNKTIFKWLLQLSDAVIALTPTMASYVRKYSKNVPIYIIPNGVELALFQSNLNRKFEFRRIYSLPEDKIIILYRGRFVSVKGFEELINAIEILNQKYEIKSKTEFLLIGDGPLREKATKKLSKYDNCKIMGWTPRETIHELYIASDIFILPSKWPEALPIALLEAMAANLFIIASKRGSIPDILQGYSRKKYLEEPSVVEIAKTLLDVIYNWHNYNSKTFREAYIYQFSWENVARQTYNVYIKSLQQLRLGCAVRWDKYLKNLSMRNNEALL